jgi:hypothetical protein
MVDLAKLTAANLVRWNAASVLPSLIPLVDGVSHKPGGCKAAIRHRSPENHRAVAGDRRHS